jgi:hypothetical protein
VPWNALYSPAFVQRRRLVPVSVRKTQPHLQDMILVCGWPLEGNPIREGTMRHRSARVSATAAFALLIALGCLCASASAHAKTPPSHQRPHQVEPPHPPVHLIRCAIVFGGSPCWPDPGMTQPNRRRWHVDPPLDEPPQFAPYQGPRRH